MRFVTFRTPKPKRFIYKPRYYDEDAEALEQKKAALGYDSRLSHRESLKLQMSRRWRKGGDTTDEKRGFASYISYLFYGLVIFGSIYLIFFTDFVYKIVALFGLRVE